MSVRRIQFAITTLLVLLACTVNQKVATAQYNIQQCTALLNQLSEYQKENAFKEMIPLARQLATYCKDEEDYAIALDALATGLNGDNQHEEALAVADRCLQTNNADVLLFCMQERANALYGLGRVQEAKTTIERALRQPAITEWDAAARQQLRMFLTEVNATLDNQRQIAPTTKSTNGIGPRPTTSEEPAKVTGKITCSGTAVGLFMEIDGAIDDNTVKSVSSLFDQWHERAAKVKAGSIKCDEQFDPSAYGVHYGINSPGGSVSAAMAIGRRFRKENAHLIVNGFCISACVLILAGAVDRQIGKSSIVGIHRPYLATTAQQNATPDQVKRDYGAMLQDIRSYLREMNVSEQLANDMLATPPERIHILTEAQLSAYGLANVDPAEQQRRAIENEVREVQEAQRLGLDRQEYTRRKALGESQCVYTSSGEPVSDYSEFWNCKQRILTTGRR